MNNIINGGDVMKDISPNSTTIKIIDKSGRDVIIPKKNNKKSTK